MLKSYVEKEFGTGKGALIIERTSLPSEIDYISKFVLDDKQIRALHYGTCEFVVNYKNSNVL